MSHSSLDISPLQLSLSQLGEVRDKLTEEIRRGLAEPRQQIKALPTYLPKPQAGLHGQALVIDTGGTNMRAAWVEIAKDGAFRLLRGPVKAKVPAGRDGCSINAHEFFLAQAELAAQLEVPAGLPVGYCFSYPAASTPERDAILLNWTKGVSISGVVGTPVGAQLAEAMAELSFRPSRVVVLNDTVAALLAGAGMYADKYDSFIGLIAGTGTNMAGFVRVADHAKTAALPFDYEHMAINLESGNFHPPHLTAWDDALNASVSQVNDQRFEKAVSGYYLPFVYQQLHPELKDFQPLLGTAQLVEGRDQREDPVAKAILERSGKLIAAGLAGFINAMSDSRIIGIVAEGSLYWGDPQQHPLISDCLRQLLEPSRRFSILHINDANLLGSAYAALG